MAVNLTEEQRTLIEKLGVYNERSGLSPAASRILGLLLVSPEPELTFDDIRETLHISKSATSNALNLLTGLKKIDYVTKSGDRKRYFRCLLMNWQNELQESFKAIDGLTIILKNVLEVRPVNTKEFNNKLYEVIDFLEFVSEELDQLYRKWKTKK